MDITDLDNKGLDPKLRSNQKVGRNKWSSTKKRQKLSSTSNETANQNLRENQASNSSNDTHERIPYKTQDLNSVQVNLFQKPLFLHQLTHNMTRDCSLNSPKNTSSEHVVYKNCFFVCFCFDIQNNICTQHVLSL